MLKVTNQIDCKEYILQSCDLINKTLKLVVPDEKDNILYQAARYSLLGDGKRIRPILTLAVTEILQGNKELALIPACAIELIHTYSLIHDDLPCMDDDDFRRGKPTLHKAYKESYAVLTGDFLLTYAFELLTQTSNLSDSQKLKLISILAKSSGSNGMVGGQLLDLEAESKQIDIKSLEQIHKCKTGAIITAAIDFAAVIAQAKPEHASILHDFGSSIGHAFQIIDDVLDATEQRDIPSSDDLKEKATYVSILGLNKARESAFKLLDDAYLKLDQLPIDTNLLKDLAKYLVHRER